ncbi:MAG: sulfatase-like hydrolase/transferase, partial [Planctomycetota bacterium]
MSYLTPRRIVIVLVVLAGLFASPGSHGADPHLNFIVILIDDMGWTGLSGYGSDLHRTPIIDALARRSMKFTHAYASASICTPTRAALMTGKYPARLNMTIWHEATRRPPTTRPLIPPVVEGNLQHEQVTIAEALR